MRMVLVRLSTGEIEVDKDVAEFAELLAAARREDRPLQIENSSGESVVVMPEHVVYFTDKLAAVNGNGAARTNGVAPLRPAEPAPRRR
jgi:hypothetical protein